MSSEEEEESCRAQERRRWRCALARDLSHTGRAAVTRRHSVTLCHATLPAPPSSLPFAPQPSPKTGGPDPPPVATLDLNLEEVGHIRSVLTRAELEGMEPGVREHVEAGRLCFLCLATRSSVMQGELYSVPQVRPLLPGQPVRGVPPDSLLPLLRQDEDPQGAVLRRASGRALSSLLPCPALPPQPSLLPAPALPG